MVGREGFEPSKAQGHLIYSQVHLTALVPTHDSFCVFENIMLGAERKAAQIKSHLSWRRGGGSAGGDQPVDPLLELASHVEREDLRRIRNRRGVLQPEAQESAPARRTVGAVELEHESRWHLVLDAASTERGPQFQVGHRGFDHLFLVERPIRYEQA